MAAQNGLLGANNPSSPTNNPNYYDPLANSASSNVFGSSWGNAINQQIAGNPQDQQLINQSNANANTYYNNQQTGPYRGGLQSSFNFSGPQASTDAYAAFDQDADVRGAYGAAAQMAHPNSGTSGAEQQALYNLYAGRIGEKNSLASSIQGNAGQERQQEDLLNGQAGQSLGQGLKNTRQNFNSRGLLYSGMRQGGEQQVGQSVAGNLSSGISGTKQDYANSKTAAENAYANVDLQQAQESLQNANNAFDTANQNNIARLQAMQQLGSGVGSAVGYMAGSYGGQPGTNPTSGWSPQQLQMPDMGSQYSPAASSGLVQQAG